MKIAGSYASVVRGVSEQVPQDRRPGQHYEQVNFISDPVRGLARRYGSILQAEAIRPSGYSEGLWPARLADTAQHCVLPFKVNEVEYDLIYRRKAVDGAYAYKAEDALLCYDKTNKQFIPIFTPAANAAVIDALYTGGVSAAVNLGVYVLLGGNNITPTTQQTNLWFPTGAKKFALWVRGPSYNREFTVELVRASGAKITASYTTPSSGYPGVLDTSDIHLKMLANTAGTDAVNEVEIVPSSLVIRLTYDWAWSSNTSVLYGPGGVALTNVSPAMPSAAGEYKVDDGVYTFHAADVGQRVVINYNRFKIVDNPDYQQQVNDRVNTYNSEVTEWITTSAEGASPAGIMLGLRDAITAACAAAGVTAPNMYLDGAYLNLISVDTGGTPGNFVEINATDNGDGSLIRAVGQTVDSLDAVSPKHWANHVVRVRPKNASTDDVTYLKAVPKSGESATNFPIDVTWQECPGVEVTPQTVFVYGTVHQNKLILGSTKAAIDAEVTAQTGSAFSSTPGFLSSSAGDLNTDPLPKFLKDKLTYLGLFQDRLVIGSGSTIFMSKPGDYYNWFRKSTLTVAADDPIEVLAYGAETDVIRSSTSYDRNLVLHGEQYQYTINGRQPITPSTAAIIIMSAHEDTTSADPKNSGNFVFYGRVYNGKSSMHQIQTGLVADSPESFEITQQLDEYLMGTPVQIVTMTAPNHVFLRTDTYRNGVYVYTYLDSAAGNERLFDAWSRWEWNVDKVGSVIGVSSFHGDLMVYTIKHGPDSAGAEKVWVSAEMFRLETKLSPLPYLDSMRQQDDFEGTGYFNANADDAGVSFAFDEETNKYMLGLPADRRAELVEYSAPDLARLWVGVDYESYITPTNPYPRDSNGKAITTGRMTLVQVVPTLVKTGGIKVTVESSAGVKTVVDRKARVLGFNNNLVGRQPITDYVERALVGKEVRDCTYTLHALTWLPLTISSIEWVGQYFNNVKRM